MRRIFEFLGKIALLGLGVAGIMGAIEISMLVAVTLTVLGGVLLGLHLLRVSFLRPGHSWPTGPGEPQQLRIGVIDHAKALVSWMLGFHRTYAIAPGLYYTGDVYDREAPLLVTANYHLSVYLVARRARDQGARLLVIDTDGINVWCAAGKGTFGNAEIGKQLARYPRDLLTHKKRLTLILPKFGMAGIDLRALKELDVRPIIGPLYAKDLPAYLKEPRLRNRDQDRVRFGLISRTFVWLPGLLQVITLSAIIAVALWIVALPLGMPLPVGVIAINAVLATAYALFFPLLPGRRFSVKGLWLGGFGSLALLAATSLGWLPLLSLLATVPYTIAAAILIGLEFTGNSAVSNYSRVKQEIVTFLPVSAVLFVVALAALITTEVLVP